MGEIKPIFLDSGSNVLSNVNSLYHTGLRKFMSLWFKFHDSNEHHEYNGSDSTDSDRPISNEGIQVDEDIFCVASHVGGFGVYRLNNDGTISKLYHDGYPHASYTYFQSVAIDKVNKLAFVGTYQVSGLSVYDISECFGGTDVVTKLGTLYIADGLRGDDFGHAYTNGLAVAGEWLYMGFDDVSSTTIQRMKYNNGSPIFEEITIQNTGDHHRYAALYYSESTDRVYFHSYYDGELDVVTGASGASPLAFSINYDDLSGIDNDAYVHCVIEDKDNPNHIYCGSGYQFFKIDITNCIVDGIGGSDIDPVLVSPRYIHRETELMTFTNMKISAPVNNNSTFIYVQGERGWNRRGGWVDTDNFNIINMARYNTAGQSQGHDYLYYDYGAKPRKITTQNNSQYWLHGGYGWDGYKFKVYTLANGMGLFETGEIVLGTYQLNNTNNIGKFEWFELDQYIYTPSGCTINIQVSNNNGGSWETYTPGSIHTFTTTGNQVRIKITMTGNGYKSGYILTNDPMIIFLTEKDDAVDNNEKIVTYKLQGGA